MEELTNTIKFIEEKIQAATGAEKTKYEESLEEAQESLKVLLKNIRTPTSNNVNQTYQRNTNIKSIENALVEVGHFRGLDISETTRFLERLDKIFTITVTEVDTTLEAEFIKSCKLRLSDSVYKNMVASQADVSTYQNLKTWLKSSYGGSFNAFQIVQRCWDIPFKKEEKFAIYGQKVSEELRVGLESITKPYQSINGASTTLTTQALMEFMAAMLVTNQLRDHCWHIYKYMIGDMDKMTTSAEVSAKAEFYRERLPETPNDTYWSGKKENRRIDKRASAQVVRSDYVERTDKYKLDKHGKAIMCWSCGKPGHYANKCPAKGADSNNGKTVRPEGKPDVTALMHSVEESTEDDVMQSVFSPSAPFH